MKAPLLSWPLPGPGWRAGDLPPAGPRHLSPAFLNRWREALEAWSAPEAAQSALDALADPRATVIVTGQQPGIWGGPLYSIYKAATAVTLAERHAARSGAPCLAVFWMNADDTDWDEVAWGAIPAPDLSILRLRWESPLEARRWVGGAALSAPPEARQAFAAWPLRSALLGSPQGETHEALGEGFARTLLAWFGGRGLLPLDARWPELRELGEPLWQGYLEAHGALAHGARAEGERLRAAGRPAPITDDAADHGLFILDGDRRRPVEPASWEGDVRALLKAGEPARLAPSVLLRAALQDWMFGSSAHVVGDAEAAYLEQLAPVYAGLSVRAPMRIPRLRATIVPEAMAPLERIAGICLDPEGWLAAESQALVPAAAAHSLRLLREEIAARLTEVAVSSGVFLKDVHQLTESARAKMDAQAQRLDEALDRRARQRLYQERPFLRRLPEFLRPRRGPQERGLSAATLALLFGEAAPRAALDAAGAHLDRLEEGALHHFFLKGPQV